MTNSIAIANVRPLLLDLEHVGAFLSISEAAVASLIDDGILQAIQVGDRVLAHVDAVVACADKLAGFSA